MHNYPIDPPEEDELPECCDEVMEYDEGTNNCVCSICEKVIEGADYSSGRGGPEYDIDAPNDWGDCDQASEF